MARSVTNALLLVGGVGVAYYLLTRPASLGYYNGSNQPYNPNVYYPTVVNSNQHVDNTGLWVNAAAGVLNSFLQNAPWGE